MTKLPMKVSFLVFLIALLSGFYLKIPLLDNVIRAFVIYVIFSVLILLIYIIHNQSAYNMLKMELKKAPHSAEENDETT